MKSIASQLIRPKRGLYTKEDLGPTRFLMGRRVFRRSDIEFWNDRGLKLFGCWFHPDHFKNDLPCVIYWHGNCGNILDCYDVVEKFLPLGYTVFAFDFAGSGNSEGKYVSLGYYEAMDIQCVIQYLNDTGLASQFALWGRSMGAASILRYAATDSSISCLVVDSSFSQLSELLRDIAGKYKVIPNAVISLAINSIRAAIQEKAQFDINDINPVENAAQCKMPALFIHSTSDKLVNISHTKQNLQAYAGKKDYIEVNGGHNTMRPKWVLDRAANFIGDHCQIEEEISIPALSRIDLSDYIMTEPAIASPELDTPQMSSDEEPGDATVRGRPPSITPEMRLKLAKNTFAQETRRITKQQVSMTVLRAKRLRQIVKQSRTKPKLSPNKVSARQRRTENAIRRHNDLSKSKTIENW